MLNYAQIALEFFRLNHNFKKSRQEILDIREKKFRKILKYAFDHSKFYHDYYLSHGIKKNDLQDIPIESLPTINKSLFIEHFDDISTTEDLTFEKIKRFTTENTDQQSKYLNKYSIVHSSGSTGNPTFFTYDDQAWKTILSAGVRAAKGNVPLKTVFSKKVRVAYIAATEGRFGGVMAASSGIKEFGYEPLILNVNLPLNEWIDQINDFQPNIIIGYPSALKILCDLIERKKVAVDVIDVVTGGEPLTHQLRQYFEGIFGVEVINIYAASESLMLGMERTNSNGFYLFDDLNYCEMFTANTFITPLYNYSQPLIRYQLSDKLTEKQRTPNEMLPFTKIESIIGRNEEIMWFINEDGEADFLHPLIIDDIDTEGNIHYQFIQHSKKDFQINIEFLDEDRQNIKESVRSNMNEILKEKKLTNLHYSIQEVDEIPINPDTGKRSMVIS